MTPDEVRAIYRNLADQYGETILLRRYSGTGAARVPADYSARGRVVDFQPGELIGGIVQGDRKAIVLAEDVDGSGIALPIIGGADKMVVRGKELAIKAVDDNTRRIAGELIAYEIRIGGV